MAKRFGTSFMVSVTPQKKVRNDEMIDKDEANLVLAPFHPQPKLLFSDIKVGNSLSRVITVINPTEKAIEIEFQLDENDKSGKQIGLWTWSQTRLMVPAGKSTEVQVTWCPTQPGSCHFNIPVKQFFNKNLHKKISQISISGNCIASKKKLTNVKTVIKSVTRPLQEKNVYQCPVKHEGSGKKNKPVCLYTPLQKKKNNENKFVGTYSKQNNENIIEALPSEQLLIHAEFHAASKNQFLDKDYVSVKSGTENNNKLQNTYVKDKPHITELSSKLSLNPKQLFVDLHGHPMDPINLLKKTTDVSEELKNGGENSPSNSFDKDSLNNSLSLHCASPSSFSKFEEHLNAYMCNPTYNASDGNSSVMSFRSSVYKHIEKESASEEKLPVFTDDNHQVISHIVSCDATYTLNNTCDLEATSILSSCTTEKNGIKTETQFVPHQNTEINCNSFQSCTIIGPDLSSGIKKERNPVETDIYNFNTPVFSKIKSETVELFALTEITGDSCTSLSKSPVTTDARNPLESNIFKFNTPILSKIMSETTESCNLFEVNQGGSSIPCSSLSRSPVKIDSVYSKDSSLKRSWNSSKEITAVNCDYKISDNSADKDVIQQGSCSLWIISPPKRLKYDAKSSSPEVLAAPSKKANTTYFKKHMGPPAKKVFHQTKDRSTKTSTITQLRPSSADGVEHKDRESKISDPRIIASARKPSHKSVDFRIAQKSLDLVNLKRNDTRESLKSNKFAEDNSISERLFDFTEIIVDLSKNPFSKELIIFMDSKFIDDTEKDLLKWVNAMLSPPLELDAVSMMPSKNQILSFSKACVKRSQPSYSEKQHRLKAMRRAGTAILLSNDVATVLRKVHTAVDKGLVAIRHDKDLHRDLGLQEIVLKLLLCYHPLWLRVALETIYGQSICLNSNSDAAGLANFIRKHLLTDQYLRQKYSHPTVPFLMMPNFEDNMKKFILYKFLVIIYFLDIAKKNKLIRHDPCLFCINSPYKESVAVLLEFNRQLIKGGDNTKYLSTFGYKLLHKQTYLEEFDLMLKSRNDLRDGIRLTRLIEIIVACEKGALYSQLRAPALSSFQKMHNMKVALNALRIAGYEIKNNVTEKDVVNGHREKILSLLWQLRGTTHSVAASIIQVFWKQNREMIKQRLQFLRMKMAACKIQKWFRNKLNSRNSDRELFLKMKSTVIFIQRSYRKKINRRKEIAYLKKKLDAAITIQHYYRLHLVSRRVRNEYLRLKLAVTFIQKKYRAKLDMKKQRIAYKKMKIAASIIGKWFIGVCEARKLRSEFLTMKKAAITIQRAYKRFSGCKKEKVDYKLVKNSVKVIQDWYRASLKRNAVMKDYKLLRTTVIMIQRKWRSLLVMKNIRREYIKLKTAAILIQRNWRATQKMKKERIVYLKLKFAVLYVEQRRKAILHTRKELMHYLKLKNSVLYLQRWWRAVLLMKKERHNYLRLKLAVSVLEEKRKALIITRKERDGYVALKVTTINVQRRWRAILHKRKERCAYLKLKSAVSVIENGRIATINARKERAHYILLKTTVIQIQRKWRALQEMKEKRIAYLKLKSAVAFIENNRLTTINTRKFRALYITMRSAAIYIQRKWRALRLMKEKRIAYLKLKLAVAFVENRRIATINARKVRVLYIAMRSAAIYIQRKWRALRLMKEKRIAFLKLKLAVAFIGNRRIATINARKEQAIYNEKKTASVNIQRWWRAVLDMKEKRIAFLKLRSAVLYVQNQRKALVIGRKEQAKYLQLKASAIILQRSWRNFLIKKKLRNELEKQVAEESRRKISRAKEDAAAIKIQGAVRRWLAHQRKERMKNAAASKIQAFWRGYCVRKKLGTKRNMSLLVLMPGNTLADIKINLIEKMKKANNLQLLLKNLRLLDIITTASPQLSFDLVQEGVVQQLYELMYKLNRNVGDQQARHLIVIVLVNLTKHNETSDIIWQITVANDGCELMLSNCLHFYKSSVPVFCSCLTLLWLWSHYPERMKVILEAPNLKYAVKTISKELINSKKFKRKTGITLGKLPSRIPNWGLDKSKLGLKTFIDPYFAWETLLKKLPKLT